MKKSLKLVFAVFLFAFFISGCNKDMPIAPDGNSSLPNPETYIVVLDLQQGDMMLSGISIKSQINNFIKINQISEDKVTFIYTTALTGFAAILTNDQLNRLNVNKYVKYIEKDKIVTLPPYKVEAKGGKGKKPKPNDPAQTTPWGITAVNGPSTTGSFSRTAWIIDTGIDLDHKDLNVVTSKCTTFVASGRDRRTADDFNGHGSHVAGIVGAKNNTIGVVGVAPGCDLVAVKVLNLNGSGYTSWVIAGLDYVANNASSGDVANMSLSGSVSTSIDDAVKACADNGIKVVVAAGNDGDDASNYSPAHVDYTNVYTISAYDNNYDFAYWSNYGTPIDWSAPGVSIYSTYKNGGYATMSGTSMATPHVTGILVAEGSVSQSSNNGGYVNNDPDSNTDKLASR